jgi:hypothetical protein
MHAYDDLYICLGCAENDRGRTRGLLVIATLACKGKGIAGESAKPYKSPKNDFTITFPAGAKDPVAKPGDEQDVTHVSANTDGTYKVHVTETSAEASDDTQGFLIGHGVHPPTEAQTKDITFQGMPAIESRGWHWLEAQGETRIEVRLVAFKPANVGKIFEITMESPKKEVLDAKAANDFFNSFKLGGS